MSIEKIRQCYEAMAGSWTGCDWCTKFGAMQLDLNGCNAVKAAATAVESTGDQATEEWWAASRWLRQVERKADDAAVQGALALAAANAGAWEEALKHAHQAWLLERESGRPEPSGNCPSWRDLHSAIAQEVGTDPPRRRAADAQAPAGVRGELAALKAEVSRLTQRIQELESQEACATPIEFYVEQ